MNKMIVAAMAAVVSISAVGMTEFEELMKKAEGGDVKALYEVGVCYSEGKGVKKNRSEAAKWYRKAAEGGSAHAMYRLGVCLAEGRGVAKNEDEALKWLRKAAALGEGKATLYLKYMERSPANVRAQKKADDLSSYKVVETTLKISRGPDGKGSAELLKGPVSPTGTCEKVTIRR